MSASAPQPVTRGRSARCRIRESGGGGRAMTGLRAWTETAAGSDREYSSDVGRAVAFRHTPGEALRLAKVVAGPEAERYRRRATGSGENGSAEAC
ncbi:hypothetical protein ACFWP3_35895 [Streptomyces sp. NPDC058525]|uniref:hypothetical protein n=1 Tax=Streptomyces sp. NPDC058525 TaxID=3346538 RepID=UPI0036473837